MFQKSGVRVFIGVLAGFVVFFGGYLAIELLLLPEMLVDMFDKTGSPSTGIWVELGVSLVLYGVLTPFAAVMVSHCLAPKAGPAPH
jgi:hypothetical protein